MLRRIEFSSVNSLKRRISLLKYKFFGAGIGKAFMFSMCELAGSHFPVFLEEAKR